MPWPPLESGLRRSKRPPEQLAPPRLFLVAPGLAAQHILDCLKAACTAGDVASLLLTPDVAAAITPQVQELGVAVLTTGEPRDCFHAHCDGLHVDAETADLKGIRTALGKDSILGVFASSSRHLAMEAAESGADYIALDQNGPPLGGEPVLAWCAKFLEVPCVAFAPSEVLELDILLPQKPDFIRPSDSMWASPEEARRIVGDMMQRLKT